MFSILFSTHARLSAKLENKDVKKRTVLSVLVLFFKLANMGAVMSKQFSST